MTVLFAANSTAAFEVNNPSDIATDTTAGRFDSAYVPGGLSVNQSGFLDIQLPSPVSELWVHFEFFPTITIGQLLEFYLGSQRMVLFKFGSGLFERIDQYNGANDTQLVNPTDHLITISTLHRCDVHYKFHDTLGEIQLYFDGILVANFSGDTILNASWGTVDGIRLKSGNTGATAHTIFSQVIVTDTDDTRNMRLFSATLTGAGTTNTFDSGAYTDVDEEGKYNDADYLESATADQLFLAAIENMPAGKVPLAVAVNARALEGGVGAPSNINLALRSGGVNYFSSDLALATVMTPVYNVWNTDPNTASAWTESGFNAIEAGIRSRT